MRSKKIGTKKTKFLSRDACLQVLEGYKKMGHGLEIGDINPVTKTISKIMHRGTQISTTQQSYVCLCKHKEYRKFATVTDKTHLAFGLVTQIHEHEVEGIPPTI